MPVMGLNGLLVGALTIGLTTGADGADGAVWPLGTVGVAAAGLPAAGPVSVGVCPAVEPPATAPVRVLVVPTAAVGVALSVAGDFGVAVGRVLLECRLGGVLEAVSPAVAPEPSSGVPACFGLPPRAMSFRAFLASSAY
ncbi:hypothetical protein MAUB1S_03438 [Mycolicibacterium aubagnense]